MLARSTLSKEMETEALGGYLPGRVHLVCGRPHCKYESTDMAFYGTSTPGGKSGEKVKVRAQLCLLLLQEGLSQQLDTSQPYREWTLTSQVWQSMASRTADAGLCGPGPMDASFKAAPREGHGAGQGSAMADQPQLMISLSLAAGNGNGNELRTWLRQTGDFRAAFNLIGLGN
jgi:hypothetical protein